MTQTFYLTFSLVLITISSCQLIYKGYMHQDLALVLIAMALLIGINAFAKAMRMRVKAMKDIALKSIERAKNRKE